VHTDEQADLPAREASVDDYWFGASDPSGWSAPPGSTAKTEPMSRSSWRERWDRMATERLRLARRFAGLPRFAAPGMRTDVDVGPNLHLLGEQESITLEMLAAEREFDAAQALLPAADQLRPGKPPAEPGEVVVDRREAEQAVFHALQDAGVSFTSSTLVPAVVDAVLSAPGVRNVHDVCAQELNRAAGALAKSVREGYERNTDGTIDPVRAEHVRVMQVAHNQLLSMRDQHYAAWSATTPPSAS